MVLPTIPFLGPTPIRRMNLHPVVQGSSARKNGDLPNALWPLTWSLIGLGCILVLAVWLPLGGPYFELRWHDQQRIGQVLIFSLVAVAVPIIVRRTPGSICPCARPILGCLLAALGLGMLSATRAQYPMWAFTEVSLMFMSVALGWTIAAWRFLEPAGADRLLMGAVLLVCSALALRFIVGYVSVMTCGVRVLDTRVLLSGFSNVRFYAQFHALTLPILVFPLLAGMARGWGRTAITGLAVVWWAEAFAGGGRGLGLAMAMAMVLLAWLGGSGRRWAWLQLRAAAAGFLLFLLLMNLIPACLGMDVLHHTAKRDLTTLSGRRELWRTAMGQIVRHPWLGVGPMHFQEGSGLRPLHPHQAVLQWAAEWGLPSALFMLGGLTAAARTTVRTLRPHPEANRPEDALRMCLSGSILAAAILSMVDGVIVMPYTMLWLAILSGWLLGLHPGIFAPTAASAPFARAFWCAGTLAATLVLVAVVSRDAPGLRQRIREYSIQHPRQTLHPRFWLLGSIRPESDDAQKKCLTCR